MADDPRGPTASQPTLIRFARDGAGRARSVGEGWQPEPDWTTGGIQPMAPPSRPWGYVVGGVLTVLWLGAAAGYGWVLGGVAGLIALAPLEVAALVGAVFAPLAFLWLLVAFADRGASMRAEAEALRRHLALLAYPADAAQDRISTISDSLRAQTRELAQATREAGNQAESLRLLMTRETADLRALAGDLGGATQDSVAAAADRVRELQSLMERITILSRDMDQALGRQHGALDDASGRAGREAERLERVLGAQAAGLADAAAAVAGQVAAAEQVTARQADLLLQTETTTQGFTDAATTLSRLVGDALEGLALRADILAQSEGQVRTNAVALAEDLRTATDSLVNLGEQVESRAASLVDLNRQVARTGHAAAQELDAAATAALGDLNAFRDATGEVLDGARTVSTAMQEAIRHGEDVRQLLASQVRGLDDAVRGLGEQVQATGETLDTQAESVAQTTERASERIRHLGELLSRSAVDITRTSARAVVEVETVSEALKGGTVALRDTVDGVRDAGQVVERTVQAALMQVAEVENGLDERTDALRAAAGAFAEEGDRLAALANDTVQALSSLGADLRAESNAVGYSAEAALDRTGALRTELSGLLAGFEDGVLRGAGEVDRAGEKLRLAAEVFEATAMHAGDAMIDRADAMEQRVRELDGVVSRVRQGVEDAATALDNHAGLLDAAGRRGVDHARRAVAELGQQVERIVTVTKDAERCARDLRTARETADVQRFLTDTSYALERLQAAAVDITRLFAPGVEDDLWKRFYKGEQNAFLRHAAKTVTRAQAGAVRKLYEQDEDFRAYADRYMGEFEALLRAARTNDRADILTGAFSASDMGRLYMVLARALNRGTVK